jgi:putative ABC transport system ATP-binding protein
MAGDMSTKFSRPEGKEPLINLSQVSKVYRNAAGAFTALKEINVNFYEGEFVGVIGKSGSGKSTLVNMITGIDRPTEGKVFVDGRNIHAMKESKQARWRGLNLGVVFQFFQLLPMLTLIENVLLPMDFCDKYDPADRQDRAMDLLNMVGLGDVAQKLPGSLSGGQQQSAAIARAMANDPPIIVADEPTGNLDAKTADSVYEKFEALRGEGRTIIMITHDPEIEHCLSRTILLSDGEVIDPILIHTLPWLPHADLKVLGHLIERQSIAKGETIDVAGRLANRLILIEEGKIQLKFSKKPHKDKQVILTPGAFLAGTQIIHNDPLAQFTAKSKGGSTSIATLSWDKLIEVLDSVEDGRQKFQRGLQAQMLGEEGEAELQTGVIR